MPNKRVNGKPFQQRSRMLRIGQHLAVQTTDVLWAESYIPLASMVAQLYYSQAPKRQDIKKSQAIKNNDQVRRGAARRRLLKFPIPQAFFF